MTKEELKAKAAMLPAMTGGDPVKQANAFTEGQKKLGILPTTDPELEKLLSVNKTAPTAPTAPTPRPPAPVQKKYWMDDRGTIWREAPRVAILKIEPALKQLELDTILDALNG